MTLNEIEDAFSALSAKDQKKLFEHFSGSLPDPISTDNNFKSMGCPAKLSAFEFSDLPQLLTFQLKRQNITYEEMAMQIGVSLSTFKRMIAYPAMAKAINLHSLLKELGIKTWLER